MTDDLGIPAHARAQPGKAAIVAGDRRVTYAELDRRVRQAARALRRRGVGEGSHVAVAMANGPEWLEVAAATAVLGAAVVPVSWRSTADEVAYLVEDSGAVLVLADDEARAVTAAVGRPALHRGAEYEAALAAEDGGPLPDGRGPHLPAVRFYTSGTTGRPKAVVRPGTPPDVATAGNLAFLGQFGIGGPDHVLLSCSPLYHVGGMYPHAALFMGHTVVMMRGFAAEEGLALVERERVTWLFVTPIHLIRILALPAEVRGRFDLSSVQLVLHGAAPCPVDVKARTLELFGPEKVWETYGGTEGLTTMVRGDEWLAKPGTVGRPAMGGVVKVLGDDGAELPPGEVGLVYQSPMGGTRWTYRGAPELDAEAWRGDLFTLGDMGYLDPDGYLFLTDRKKDVVITGGTNVYPAEVERVLRQHPAVVDVAVVGVPDDEWGEVVAAVVEARSAVAPDELRAFCRQRLAAEKWPRLVELVDALPRDPVGKVRKRELRDRFWAGRATRI